MTATESRDRVTTAAPVARPRRGTRAFLDQLRWEVRKTWVRPRTYAGFVAAFLFELLLSLLWRLPTVRQGMGRQLWRVHVELGAVVSGLTTAVHMTANTMALIGALFLALVASDVVAKEFEDGTLRMALSRPVGRGALFTQKLVACALYTVALTIFVGASALALGLLFEGPGRLVIIAIREGVFGALGFRVGLQRYAVSIGMLVASMMTVTLLAFALSCFRMKPATAIVIAATVLLADHLIRLEPALAHVAPYCLTTRLVTWRQVFNQKIPWLRIHRNYRDLLRLDVALLLVAWWRFRRRELSA